MITYQLYCTTTKPLQLAGKMKKVTKFFIKRRRAVILSKGPLIFPENVVVHEEEPSDVYGAGVEWAQRSILDDVASLHAQSNKFTSAKRARVIDAWVMANDAVDDAEKYLELAKDNARTASKNMALTFGRANVAIGDETYDPSFNCERIIYLKRQSK